MFIKRDDLQLEVKKYSGKLNLLNDWMERLESNQESEQVEGVLEQLKGLWFQQENESIEKAEPNYDHDLDWDPKPQEKMEEKETAGDPCECDKASFSSCLLSTLNHIGSQTVDVYKSFFAWKGWSKLYIKPTIVKNENDDPLSQHAKNIRTAESELRRMQDDLSKMEDREGVDFGPGKNTRYS